MTRREVRAAILAGVDFSDVEGRVVDEGMSLAGALGAALHVLHVAEPDPTFVGYVAGPESVRDQVTRPAHWSSLSTNQYGARRMLESMGKSRASLIDELPRRARLGAAAPTMHLHVTACSPRPMRAAYCELPVARLLGETTMLRSLHDLERYAVSASDGDIGAVVDFLLDDQRWTVRYLVVETGSFFASRRVLLSPISFRDPDWLTHRFHVALTMDKVKKSPSIDTDEPVSRQREREYALYYDYPHYWGYSGLWGMGASPGSLAAGRWHADPPPDGHAAGDVHLRSAREVRGYRVEGSDDAIGHVDDFVIDDETWAIRYLVVDTSNWWLGKRVLVAPHWATDVVWSQRRVHVDMSRRAIKDSPAWDPTVAVNREYETRLYDYYGRPVYWAATATQPSVRRPAIHTT